MKADRSCLDKALRLLGRRDHSCRELSQKLKQRGFTADVIAAAIATCVERNYLDDRRFCGVYTGQLRRRGYGVMRIVQKLKEKGIADAHIHESIDRSCQEASQIEDCRKVVDRRIPVDHPLPSDEKGRDRLFRFLYQRGFSSDVIISALRERAAGRRKG